MIDFLYEHARKIIVFIIGLTIIVIGVALLVLPGPGWVTIFIGLGILSVEFVWARKLLEKARRELGKSYEWISGKNDDEPTDSPSGGSGESQE